MALGVLILSIEQCMNFFAHWNTLIHVFGYKVRVLNCFLSLKPSKNLSLISQI